ncbi:hypothetical protein [Chromobacterium subtsugae]|uniref:hypothetical protein n=1 Tax=Chromobacterium subtsugae TaxID=251747 RepID=UPI001C10AFF2|nr:hypothetical protein [Chromobacterium subtsugae]
MGSTGSGHFSDYSGAKRDGPAGQGGSGGMSGVDRCQLAFSTTLEEVAQCDFYARMKAVPPPGFELSVVLDRRVFAVDSNGIKIGALPTSFNYLAACLASGTSYVGVVKSSTIAPIPTVEVDFVPQ